MSISQVPHILFHASLDVALVVSAALAIELLARGASPRLKVWLWRAVMVKLGLSLLGLGFALLPTVPQVAGSGTSTAGPDWVAVAVTASWVAGGSIGVLAIIREFLIVRRLVREATRIEAKEITTAAEDLARELRLIPLPILESRHTNTALIAWHIRSHVILPADWRESLPGPMAKMAVAHELAHAKGRDFVWAWLTTLVGIGLFFHPGFWLARRSLRLAHEAAADALAVEITRSDRFNYAGMLIEIARQPRQGALIMTAALGASPIQEDLRYRINLLGRKPPHRAASATALMLSLCLIPAMAVTFRPSPSDLSSDRSDVAAPHAPNGSREMYSPARRLGQSPAGSYSSDLAVPLEGNP